MTKQQKYIPALGYDWLTGLYDLTIKLTMPEKKFRNKLVDEINPVGEEHILEFGYGTGENLLLVLKRTPQVHLTGVDIDPKVREIALKKIENSGLSIPLDLYDGNRFPYQDGTFDKVFSSLVFHQLDRRTKLHCLREIFRVLKKGGKLVIGDWGKSKTVRSRAAFYLVQILDGFETTSDNVKGLLPTYIAEAGFSGVQETSYINTSIGTYCYYQAIK